MRSHVIAVCVAVLACRSAVAEGPAVSAAASVKPHDDAVQPSFLQPQVCPRPDALYAPTPVGLITPVTDPRVAVLRQKEADIAQLQQEVNKLRAETGAEQQILVRVQVMEVSLTKMEKMGLSTASVTSGYANMPAADATQLVRTLSESRLGKMMSEPTVVALDGQPASVHIGGDMPYPAPSGAKGAVDLRPIGTQLDVVPQTLGDNRVRVDLRVRISNTNSGQMIDINGSHVPLLGVKQINTKVEAAIGTSVILTGMNETRVERVKIGKSGGGTKTVDEENRIGTIIIVTPEFADRVASAGALPSQPKPYTPR